MFKKVEEKPFIGCIGKCISGLKQKEVDLITDNIKYTLTHPKGREIFIKYLTRANLQDDLICANFYLNICNYIEKEKEYTNQCRFDRKKPTLDTLKNDVRSAMETAEELDIEEIDISIMRQFEEAMNSESKEKVIAVLENTKERLTEHLRHVHNNFKAYILEPCPRNSGNSNK